MNKEIINSTQTKSTIMDSEHFCHSMKHCIFVFSTKLKEFQWHEFGITIFGCTL